MPSQHFSCESGYSATACCVSAMPPSNLNELRHRLTLIFEQQVKSIPDLDIECCAPNQEAIDRKWADQSTQIQIAVSGHEPFLIIKIPESRELSRL